jgi:hypothetical protein
MLYHHWFFIFALEYAVKKDQENQAGLKLNGTHQPLAYADDGNLLGDNMGTINKNTETLIDASKEVGLEVTNYLCGAEYHSRGYKLCSHSVDS